LHQLAEDPFKSNTPNVDHSKSNHLIPVVRQPSGGPPSTIMKGDRIGHPESLASFEINKEQ